MKNFIVLIANLLVLNLSGNPISHLDTSTEPQQIVPITQILHEKSYYETQVNLWEEELAVDDTEPNAWLNFYLASRTVNMLTTERNPNDLNEIYNSLAQKIPDSFEYNYLTYLNGQGNDSLFHHIEKAYAMDPERSETYSLMINHYITLGQEEKVDMFCEKWLESGQFSAGILNWNYNALIALEENAILLTNGDNDTYPSWILQRVNQVRPDIKVINVHLLKNKEYLNRSFAQIQLDGSPLPSGDKPSWSEDLTPIVDYLMEHTSRPLYLNVTLPKRIRENYKDVLYTVGLAFRYSRETMDNLAILKDNYENKFLKDYLKIGFLHDRSATVINALNVNYLPAFMSLYQHYIVENENTKAEDLKEVILTIGRANGKEDQILKLITPPKTWDKNVTSYMDIKSIDKSLKEIKPGLWAAESETTNASYEQFLMDLLKNKEFELLEICKTTKTDWMSLLPKKFKHISEEEAYRSTGGRPDDPMVPVTNISYEAAQAYCDWLTLAYNGYDKKKKYQKVKFRLPSEDEWEYAAKAKNNEAPYPWGGHYYKNVKGCYLSNFYSSDDEPCHDCKFKSIDNDGGFFLVTGTAYFPNDLGLYGMSGNAAEMTQGGQVAKGGSWEDLPADCTIDAKKEIKGISPAIGFRVFMETIK